MTSSDTSANARASKDEAHTNTSRRDKSSDGLRNRAEAWLLTHIEPAWSFINQSPSLAKVINRILINNAVNKTRNRPHPLSMKAPYTTWPSLTDKTWYGRYLPESTVSNLPSLSEVTELFRRTGGMKVSPKSTNLFPVFAQWFTDGFLRTADDNRRRTTSSHQIDLSQVYGQTDCQTNTIREMSNKLGRRGRLKTQFLKNQAGFEEEYAPYLYESDGITKKSEFANLPTPMRLPPDWPIEKRATLFAFGGDRANSTAQTAMVNTLFIREHNRICGEIEQAYPDWDDERVFQISRNICIALLIRVVVEEYINHIAPYHFKFRGEPNVAWTARWNRPNWIPVEFNLLYRWHNLVPDKITWGSSEYSTMEMAFDNSKLTTIGFAHAFEATSRQAAGHLALHNTPDFLYEAEKNSIKQGRDFCLATYNDYREAMSYPRVSSFDQVTGDSKVAAELKHLYKTVDRIELYVGLFAEDTKVNGTVPPLIGRMVGIDAFSHALTNPLLSEHIFNADTFTPVGMKVINETTTLASIFNRNINSSEPTFVSMTREDWVRQPPDGF